MRKRFVYGIYIGRRIIYVGVTKHPAKRFIQHYLCSMNLTAHRPLKIHIILNKMMRQSIIPRFKILDVSIGFDKEWLYITKHKSTIFNSPVGTLTPADLGEFTRERVKDVAVLSAYKRITDNTEMQLSFIKKYMEITVKQLADSRGISKVYILRLLKNNKAHLLSDMGIKSWQKVGSQYVLTMQKDFSLKDQK